MPYPLIRWTPRLAIVAMLATIVVFGTNFAVSRYGIQHGLSAYDIVFLRFGVAGPLLLPLFVQRGVRDCAGIGWAHGLALALTGGALVTIFVSVGASLAPAAHGAALGPGTVTIVGVVYATILAGRLPPPLTRIGLVLALSGLVAIGLAASASGSSSVLLGDVFYFLTGLLWGFYPVLLHRWRVDGMTGAIVCAVLSLGYVPVYFAYLEPRLLEVPLWLVLGQALYQGVLNSILGLWLWGQGVRVLGASGVQLFPPLIPVVGALSAIPILGEWPGPLQTLGIALIVSGLALSTYGNRRPAPSSEL